MVTLYSRPGCIKCEQLKMLLDKNNIKYEINTSVDKMIQLGIEMTPVLCVGDKLLNVKEAEKWIVNYKAGESI